MGSYKVVIVSGGTQLEWRLDDEALALSKAIPLAQKTTEVTGADAAWTLYNGETEINSGLVEV